MRRLFIKTAILIVFMISGSYILSAQNETNKELSNYKIAIESIDNVIKLSSQKGCAWKELTIELKNDEAQVIDQFGIVSKTRNTNTQVKNLANFKISICRTSKGISLKGLKGTSWKDLNYGNSKTNNYFVIDQNGMTSGQLKVKF